MDIQFTWWKYYSKWVDPNWAREDVNPENGEGKSKSQESYIKGISIKVRRSSQTE